MKVWALKSGHDRRFRSGHPWVYSNELQASPHGIEPGEPVLLTDPGGKRLAIGFGHPHSLIAFRRLAPVSTLGVEDFFCSLRRAWKRRMEAGLTQESFRLFFGEADGIPGLIMDAYLLVPSSPKIKNGGRVLVVQAQSAGADRWLKMVESSQENTRDHWRDFLNEISEGHSAHSAVIIRNDAGARARDGLKKEEPRILWQGETFSDRQWEESALIQVEGARFTVHFLNGQKTGFFLDQRENTRHFGELLSRAWTGSGGEKVSAGSLHILDLCAYVGQWSVQLGRRAQDCGYRVEVTQVDLSREALHLAKRNAEDAGLKVHSILGDAIRDLREEGLKPGYDVVIADPPALIQSKKDLGPGTHAYVQVMGQAMRSTRHGGWLIASSCSGLLTPGDFQEVLAKAAKREKVEVQWLSQGGQAPDHPVKAEFPEGRYLKAWLGRVYRNEEV